MDDGIENVPDYTRSQERNLLKKALLLRSGIQEALAVLERKASGAESRAMDIRLRVDHEKIAALIAGRDLVSKLKELVEGRCQGGDRATASSAPQLITSERDPIYLWSRQPVALGRNCPFVKP